MELAAGSAPDEAVYVDSVPAPATSRCWSCSTSRGRPASPARPADSAHEHQRAAAGALTLALHDLGDRVALYGFRSLGRQAVQVLPVKRFGDRLDARARSRLRGWCRPPTRLGAAIRHGASVLEAEGGTARRLLRRAVGRVRLRPRLRRRLRRGGRAGRWPRAAPGYGCLCLSIAAGTDVRALRRVFGTAAHAALPHAGTLPATVGPLFRPALQRAEAHRRVSQHRQRAQERLRIEESRT